MGTRLLGTLLLAAGLALASGAARAVDLELAPEETRISFELGSTLHRVEGVARLEDGVVHFDPAGGAASGRIRIDARSLDSGNGLRDGQMHGKVLESERYPRIEFVPEGLEVADRSETLARVVLRGTLHLHGGAFPLRIPAEVAREGEAVRVRGSFAIPYVEWGLRDMSNFLLSVDPEVVVHVDALARLAPPLETAEARP